MKTYIPAWKRLPRSIAKEYTDGATVLGLSIKYKQPEGAVREALRNFKVRMRSPGIKQGTKRPELAKVTDEQIQEILYIDEHHPEIDHSELSKHYGISRERVRQICLAAGHPTRREKIIPKAWILHEQTVAKRIKKQEFIKKVSESWKSGMSMKDLSLIMYGRRTSNTYISNRISTYRNKYGEKMFPYRMPHHWQLQTMDERAKKVTDIAREWNAHGSKRRIRDKFGYANTGSAAASLFIFRKKWPHLFKAPEEIMNYNIKKLSPEQTNQTTKINKRRK